MIYVAADLHLREHTWKSHKEIEGDQYFAWAKLCLAVSKDPDGALVLAGDIFDTPYPTGLTEMAFSKGMQMLRGKPCYFIPGNHDNEVVPRPQIFGAIPLEPGRVHKVCGLNITGIPFTRSTEALQTQIANTPISDILVLHTGFRHLLGFDETWQVSEDDIPEHVGMVMVGHVHLHSEHGKVYSPGSLALHRADEIDKGHGYFTIDGNKKVEWHEIRTRRYVQMTVGENVDNALLEELANCDDRHRPVVLLDHKNDDAPLADAIQDRWKGRILFMCNARASETIKALDESPEEVLDLKTVVSKWLASNLTEEQQALATAMLQSQDPAATLDEYIKEREKT